MDLWTFDLAALRWTDLTAATFANGPTPGFRQRTPLVPFKGLIYMYAGFGQQEEALNTTIIDPSLSESLTKRVGPKPVLPLSALVVCQGDDRSKVCILSIA